MAGSIFADRPQAAPVPPRKPPAKAQSVEKVMVILRNFFEQRPNSVLLGCFREQDADGSGQLGLPEFTRALTGLNINLSEADIAGVFNALDTDGGGVLELKEFLNELKSEPNPKEAQWLRLGIGHQYIEPNREPPSTLGVKPEPWMSGFNRGNRCLVDDKSIPEPKRDETVLDIGDSGDNAETALTLLRDFFSRRPVSSLLTLFQDVDQDESGQIDVDEFSTAMRQLNMQLSEEDIRGLFNYFDHDGSGVCEVREILAVLKAEPTVEESRWQRIGIGKQMLTPTREVHTKGVKPSTGQSGFSRSEGPWPTQRPEPTARLPGEKAAGAVVKKPVSVGLDIVQSVRTFLGQRSSASTLTVFRDQDKDRSGKIEAKEFGDALKQLGMNDLSDEDIAAAFHVFDPDGSGIIELSELLNELRAEPATGFTRRTSGIAGRGVSLPACVNNAATAFARRAEARTKPGSGVGVTGFAAEKGLASGFGKDRGAATAADPRGEAAMGERLADVMLLLRDFFNKRPASTVLGCFRAQDFDRSGKFELKEFALALKAFGFQMSDEDYELVFNWFDKDGSGVVELKEFLNELRSEPSASWTRVGIGRQRVPPVKHANMSQPPQGNELRYEGSSYTRECDYVLPEPAPTGAGVSEHKAVERVLATLRDFFQQRPNSVLLGCFREQDADGSGQLELPEFTRALRGLGLDLSDADIAGVFNELDADGSGVMELKEFLNKIKSEPDPREAQWLRLGIGHNYVEPNREPPATKGVVHEPWLSGFNRGYRVLVGDGRGAHNKHEESPHLIAAAEAEAAARREATNPEGVSSSATTALMLLRDFFSRRSVASLITLFQDVDVDNSGKINGAEFCMALRQLNMQLSEEDMMDLFNFFDKDGGGQCEVKEILAVLKAEPTPEESRWQQLGIGKQTLNPTRDVYVKGVKPSTGESGFARSVNNINPPGAQMPTHRIKQLNPPQEKKQISPAPGGGLSSWPPAFR